MSATRVIPVRAKCLVMHSTVRAGSTVRWVPRCSTLTAGPCRSISSLSPVGTRVSWGLDRIRSHLAVVVAARRSATTTGQGWTVQIRVPPIALPPEPMSSDQYPV